MNKKEAKPAFTLIAAVSLDGRITYGSKEGTTWTSKEDQMWFHAELDRYDAVILGRKTFAAIKRPITSRNRIVFSRSSVIPAKAGIQNTIQFCGSERKIISLCRQRGWFRIAILGGTEIYDWFLKRGLVDEMYLTLEPLIFGSGKTLASQTLRQMNNFALTSIKKLNSQGSLLLHYKSDS